MDQEHQGGDPGEDDPPEGGPEGARSPAESTCSHQTKESRQEVSRQRQDPAVARATPNAEQSFVY